MVGLWSSFRLGLVLLSIINIRVTFHWRTSIPLLPLLYLTVNIASPTGGRDAEDGQGNQHHTIHYMPPDPTFKRTILIFPQRSTQKLCLAMLLTRCLLL
jgi:hypothetical protein